LNVTSIAFFDSNLAFWIVTLIVFKNKKKFDLHKHTTKKTKKCLLKTKDMMKN